MIFRYIKTLCVKFYEQENKGIFLTVLLVEVQRSLRRQRKAIEAGR